MNSQGKRILSFASALLLALVSASSAEKFDQLVGAVAPEGDAYLIKHFPVARGSVISGVRFYTNDTQTTFPAVILLRGPARTLSSARVVAEFSNLKAMADRHLVVAACEPIPITSVQDLYVAIRLPVSDGISATRTGAGIGARILQGATTSYFASGVDGRFGAMDVDFGIDLVYEHAGKPFVTGKEDDSSDPASLPAVLQVRVSQRETASGSVFALALPKPAHILLDVYDVAGRRVSRVTNDSYPAGWHDVPWNGKDTHGRSLASGVYLYKVRVDSEQRTGKVVILR